jgi:hypothetical protein
MEVPLGAERTASAGHATPAHRDDRLGKATGVAVGLKIKLEAQKSHRQRVGKSIHLNMTCRKHPFSRSL